MLKIKNEKGNTLVNLLALIIFFTLIIFLGLLLIHPTNTINSDSNKQLQSMISEVKNTEFESTFNARINHNLADGKLTNKEFAKLELLFNGYKIAQETGGGKAYKDTANADFIKESKTDKQGSSSNILYIFLGAFFMTLLSIFGWIKVRGN